MKLPEEKSYESCPEGTHGATCYQVIDFGSRDFQGDKKFKRKVWIGWELLDERMEDGRPFACGHEYTLSSYSESPLRQHLEAWRGSKFDDADFGPEGKFSIENLLGAACLISVKQNEKGRTKVKSVIAPPKGSDRRVPPENPPVYLSLEPNEFDAATWDKIPEWMQKTICESPEWKALQGGEVALEDDLAKDSGNADDVPF